MPQLNRNEVWALYTTMDKRSKDNTAEHRVAPTPRHHVARDELKIGTDAGFRVLLSYQGKIRLDLIKRLSGVTFQ